MITDCGLQFAFRLFVLCIVADSLCTTARADAPPRNVSILAGAPDKAHPPGTHEYEKSARLIKQCLDGSPNAPVIQTSVHLNGWPENSKTLEKADAIVVIASGSDRRLEDHPLLAGDRLAIIDRQMRRGCGLVLIHWATFAPKDRAGDTMLDWVGGYFDYESGPTPRRWYSKITTTTATVKPATPNHPILRGIAPFDLREEFYYNMRFRPGDKRLRPIAQVQIPGESELQTIAWAIERADGGRGFGFTGGHFFDNWRQPDFRRLVLNAIVWSAKAEVPLAGIDSVPPPNEQVERRRGTALRRAVIVTGHQHPAHLWKATTKTLSDVLAADARLAVSIAEDPEYLARQELHDCQLVVMNYCNWERTGLSPAARQNFVRFLSSGGGLAIIHFANGAFHFSLPKAGESDWLEWRTRICRRVWDHSPGKSGHDAYGPFHVDIVAGDHPITKGLAGFETTDELYFRQQGDEPIIVLAKARSKVTLCDEPIAFVHDYGDGRVFQTVLGHDANSLRNAGTSELIRRGAAWAAGLAPDPETKRVPTANASNGRFGGSLDARIDHATVDENNAYRRPPLTVECWTRLFSKLGFNVLVANAPKESPDHWEIYTYAGSGEFSVYLPGFAPSEIKSGVSITDTQWHHVAMSFDGQMVRLFVDGKSVHESALTRVGKYGPSGPLWIGAYPPQRIGCDGLVDDVRISNSVRPIRRLPDRPAEADLDTVGLWRFDEPGGREFSDLSRLANPAKLGVPVRSAAEQGSYTLADKSLKVVQLDHSPSESFLSIRADTTGRLFVGGREALFVYEPNASGGYEPRRLLCRFPPDSWLTNIELRGDDLYIATAPAIYLLPSGRVRRENLQPQRIVSGPPLDLHVTLHGLAWGPEGDLYFNCGDPLLNHGDFKNRPDHWGHWTFQVQPKGTITPYTGVGGFFRVKPDGSKLRVYASGTRGTDGLAFDRAWNLFSNDNDHESLPAHYVPARLLHVTHRAHFFWPRGWMASKSPDRADLLETMYPGMGREAPVGMAYYDEPYLPASYRHSLLVALWGQRRIDCFSLVPRGASFSASPTALLIGGGTARPVGVAVGRGGRIFATISYMAANEHSPRYPSDLVMITRAEDDPNHPFEAFDAVAADDERLWQELSNASAWQRRQAHVEILRRGGPLLDRARQRLETLDAHDPSKAHTPWLAAASDDTSIAPRIARLISHADPIVRQQAAGILSELRGESGNGKHLVPMLADVNPRVRLAALEGLLATRTVPPLPFVESTCDDANMRQATAFLLADCSTIGQLEQLLLSANPNTRLIGVLAIGFRLTVPPSSWVPPSDLTLNYTHGNAFFKITYADETVDLRTIGRVGSFTTADWWKLMQTKSEPRRMSELLGARLSDADRRVRLQAAYFLSLLADAATDPLVEKVRHDAVAQQLQNSPKQSIRKAWVIGPFEDGPGGSAAVHPPENGPIDLTAKYVSGNHHLEWRIVSSASQFDLQDPIRSAGEESHYLYFRLDCLQPGLVARLPVSDEVVVTWHNGRILPAKNNNVLYLEPGSNDILIRVRVPAIALEFRASGRVEPSLPERMGNATLATRLRDAADVRGESGVAREFLSVDWVAAAAVGDQGRGRKLFGPDVLGCSKCHSITADQQGMGAPSLAAAAKRFTVAHLVESILVPDRQVAPLFRATLIARKDGSVVTGLAVEETDNHVVLLLPNATRQAIDKSEIEQRRIQDLSPMPHGLVKTPNELRDLLAYLLSENPKPP